MHYARSRVDILGDNSILQLPGNENQLGLNRGEDRSVERAIKSENMHSESDNDIFRAQLPWRFLATREGYIRKNIETSL